MDDKDESKKPRQIRYETATPTDLPAIYANNVDMSVSMWDMRFRFGQVESADDAELLIKNVITVYMSALEDPSTAEESRTTQSQKEEGREALNAPRGLCRACQT